MRFGRNVARTLFEYYRFTNVLIVPLYVQLTAASGGGQRRRGRPRTHHGRSRTRHISPDLRPRPRTTRAHAPIAYTDLCMRIDGGAGGGGYDGDSDPLLSSPDGSPVRAPAVRICGGFGARSQGNIYMQPLPHHHHHQQHQLPDQFSLLAIQASKFSQLDFSQTQQQQQQQQSAAAAAGELRLPRIRFAADAGATSTIGGVYTTEKMSVAVPKPSLSIIDFNQITRGGLERATKRYDRQAGRTSRH